MRRKSSLLLPVLLIALFACQPGRHERMRQELAALQAMNQADPELCVQPLLRFGQPELVRLQPQQWVFGTPRALELNVHPFPQAVFNLRAEVLPMQATIGRVKPVCSPFRRICNPAEVNIRTCSPEKGALQMLIFTWAGLQIQPNGGRMYNNFKVNYGFF